jgi:hypothetical protein
VKEWQNAWKAGRDGHDAFRVEPPVEIDPEYEYEALVAEAEAALIDYIQERVRICGQHPQARARLSQQWPPGVPTPRKGLSEPAHITQVLDLLDAVERDFSLPFTGGDPRIKGKHLSELPIPNSQVP